MNSFGEENNETLENWTFVGPPGGGQQVTGLAPHLGLALKVSYGLVCGLGLVINLLLLAAIIGELGSVMNEVSFCILLSVGVSRKLLKKTFLNH